MNFKTIVRMYFYRIVTNCLVLLAVGFAVGTVSSTYVLTDTLAQIDKVLVCK